LIGFKAFFLYTKRDSKIEILAAAKPREFLHGPNPIFESRSAYKCSRNVVVWGALAILPYIFGFSNQTWIEWNRKQNPVFSVALVQTSILPEQRDYYPSKKESFIPFLDQWERIFLFLDPEKKVDLIVLPETALPIGAHRYLYPIGLVKYYWQNWFGTDALSDLPPLESPLAVSHWENGVLDWKVNNAFLCQAFANHYNSHLIIGLDDHDLDEDAKYNAAFHFQPKNMTAERYEKRILVPVVEYIPFKTFDWVSHFLLEQFGIEDSFCRGSEGIVFQTRFPIGISICIEETFSELIRDLRRKGAEVLVNISNDVWFPKSRLPLQHFDHGKVRAVENGVCSLRACNTGITGAVDCFGRTVAQFPPSESAGGALYISLPILSYNTLYTLWGDSAILALSIGFVIFGLLPWNWSLEEKVALNGELR
jgi:apolipoprotein N-acyltransferase